MEERNVSIPQEGMGTIDGGTEEGESDNAKRETAVTK